MTRPPRLDTLDAMRGVAALAVLVFHAGPQLLGRQLLPGAYLAVDFFFLLSGFVLARAFDSQIPELGFKRFMALRLKRLYLLMAASILAGAAVKLYLGVDPLRVVFRLVAQLAFLPSEIGPYELYPLNGAQWSLACELAANAVHASLFVRRSAILPLAVFILYGILLVVGAHNHGSLAIGDTVQGWAWGMVRVGCAYSLGVAIHRLNLARLVRRCPVWVAPLILSALMIGRAQVPEALAGMLDPLFVLIAFPAVLLLGASATGVSRVGQIAGGMSYPLYVFHLPLLTFLEGTLSPGPQTLLTGLCLAVALALLVDADGRRVRMGLNALLEKALPKPLTVA